MDAGPSVQSKRAEVRVANKCTETNRDGQAEFGEGRLSQFDILQVDFGFEADFQVEVVDLQVLAKVLLQVVLQHIAQIAAQHLACFLQAITNSGKEGYGI